METLVLVALFKILIVGIVLCAAAISDIKTRRVSDRYWILLLAASAPLLLVEIYHMGGAEKPLSFLLLGLPIGFMVFALYGYPEIREIMEGKFEDIIFGIVYLGAAAATIIGAIYGDRSLLGRIAFSSLFMLIYFILYSVPIAGVRIIHGGADAKCMISLAAVFPWYGEKLPIWTGPFYDLVIDHTATEFIFPFHFSVMLNGALVTVVFLALFLPVMNMIRGRFHPVRMFTSYVLDVDDLAGRFVWVYIEEDGKRRKVDPTPEVIRDLVEDGKKEVRVTPKIPFIVSLALGFAAQVVFGNLGLILLLWLM
ncbi:MAG: prepilin peptidase [Thermoplasmatota archaeon]